MPVGTVKSRLHYAKRALRDALEEESRDDRDYYINETTIDGFEQSGADAELVKFLRYALNGRTEMEIRWVRV